VPIVAVLHHLDRPFLGHVREPLERAGVEIDERRLVHGDPLPDLDATDGVVVLGGEQSAAGDADGLGPQLAFLRDAFEREVPVFGVCLGGQLLARALGGEVRHVGRSVEWRELDPLPAAAQDPVFGALAPPVPALHFNEDVFEPPPDAVELLSRGGAGAEAFRVGPVAWGVQYHPDVDPEILTFWLEQYSGWMDGVDMDSFRAEGERRVAQQKQASDALFSAFARVVAERA
jgi:GMP synthase-like glutamine amidotransferase